MKPYNELKEEVDEKTHKALSKFTPDQLRHHLAKRTAHDIYDTLHELNYDRKTNYSHSQILQHAHEINNEGDSTTNWNHHALIKRYLNKIPRK